MYQHQKLSRLTLLAVVSLKMAAGAMISVSPSSTSVGVGSSFVLNVDASNVVDLYAFQFDLIFNPAVIGATSGSEGSLLSDTGNFFPGFIDNPGGVITFVADTFSGPIPGVTGGGRLASISFDAIGAGTSLVSVSNVVLLDSTLADIPLTEINSGTVSSITGVVPEPSTLGYISLTIVGIGVMRRCRRRGPCSSRTRHLLQ